ncbi:MAG: DUF4393 domain-containing protein [Deltaproteobacteria bacterium]|nr:DUF4393 domain-containing protein [Deltaproteobacteria bacterium]
MTKPLLLPGAIVDVAARGLTGVVQAFKRKASEIPQEDLREPEPRLVHRVFEGASKSIGDEPDLQELFAQLLASGCDGRHLKGVRANFADLIVGLESTDAYVLKALASSPQAATISELVSRVEATEDVESAVRISLDNLQRLGIVHRTPVPAELGRPSGLRSAFVGSADVERTAETVVEATADAFESLSRDPRFVLSAMGRAFCEVALPAGSLAEVGPEPTVRRMHRKLRGGR